jgi:hypothetical protein
MGLLDKHKGNLRHLRMIENAKKAKTQNELIASKTKYNREPVVQADRKATSSN